MKSFVFAQSTPKQARSTINTNKLISNEEANRDLGYSKEVASAVNKDKIKRMSSKNRVMNKLALVLISLIVLELVLIGDQVQPVKAIKKKIYLKKLKKLLPLFALVKPKKKIILLPVSEDYLSIWHQLS